MPYAVNVRADNDSAEPIRSLWTKAEEFETSPSMRGLGYSPHITLAVYEELPDGFPHVLDFVFGRTQRLQIRFERLGHFLAPRGLVLWLGPGDSDCLRSLHESVHAEISPELCRPNYRPGRWVPHCSIATAIDHESRDDALRFVSNDIEAFEVVFDVADCVFFSPVEIITEMTLGNTSR